ncbi:GPR endopeptidase [Bacillus sp. SL00103]
MGLTGIETSDIIQGVIERSKPDFVIAIDALLCTCSGAGEYDDSNL